MSMARLSRRSRKVDCVPCICRCRSKMDALVMQLFTLSLLSKTEDEMPCLSDRGKGVPSFDEMMDIALVAVDFDDPTTNVRGRRALAMLNKLREVIDHAGARST